MKVLRLNWRISWFEEALAQLGGRDVVLFDPDNGMAPSDRVTGAHATTEEVYRFLSSGSSVVIVQYGSRTANALANVCRTLRSDLRRARHGPAPFALRWSSDGPAGFLIVPVSQGSERDLLSRARILASSHPAFFSLLPRLPARVVVA